MGFRDTLRTIRKKISKKASLALAAALVVGGITGAVATKSVKADSRNCDNNAVVYCGAFSIPELQARYKSDSVTRAIYAASAFNISATDVAGMGNAKVGAVYKDGRVVVDGRVVRLDVLPRRRRPHQHQVARAGRRLES